MNLDNFLDFNSDMFYNSEEASVMVSVWLQFKPSLKTHE